ANLSHDLGTPSLDSGVTGRLLIATLMATWALTPSARAASRVPCVPGGGGPSCHAWTGNVTFIDDGDTVDVRLDGGRGVWRWRVAVIQAMEQTAYSHDPAKRRGSCNALQATARVDSLVR